MSHVPRIAIHDRPGSFSERWIELCREQKLQHRVVNAYSGDILMHLKDMDALLWHWGNREPAGLLFARSIIRAAEAQGTIVFPNTPTCWHYDDKVAQSYLLQATNSPVVPFYAFYGLEEALEWIEQTSWPKVFKTRGGSGSRFVKLIHNKSEARAVCKQAFGSGFDPAEKILNDVGIKLVGLRKSGSYLDFLKRLPTKYKNWKDRSRMPRERGYVYFQEFLASNTSDTRVTVIGDRAFGFRRHVRPGDFRASGSGRIDHEQSALDPRCFQIAHETARVLGSQSMAFDFVFDGKNEPKIVEISYAYMSEPVHRCPGHYDSQMQWHEGHVWPEEAILNDVLRMIEKSAR